MSARIGNPALITAAAAALGGASGRTYALNNPTWILFVSSVLTWVATATVGSRNPVLRFLDPSGNIVLHMIGGAASLVTAGTTTRLLLSSVLQGISTNTVPAQQLMAFLAGGGLSLPPFSSFVVFDASNIDPADTLQLNSLIFSY
ncbi:MAG TPA: hypothetical protein VF748_17435 [Candidatus Acidoferrum sp.]